MNGYLPNPTQLYELERQRRQELIAKAATARLARNVVEQQRVNHRPLAMLWQVVRTVVGREVLIAWWRDQPAATMPQS